MMDSRRELRKQDVRDRLLKSALSLFRQNGVDRTTVDDIVKKADTSKGTFFNYFPTKDDVLVSYYEQLAERAFVSARRVSRRASSERRVASTLKAFSSTAEGDLDLVRELLRAVFSKSLVAAADKEHEDALHVLLRSILENGIDNGELRSDLDLEVFCSLLTSALSTTIQDWVRDGGPPSIGVSLERKVACLFQGAYSTDWSARKSILTIRK